MFSEITVEPYFTISVATGISRVNIRLLPSSTYKITSEFYIAVSYKLNASFTNT